MNIEMKQKEVSSIGAGISGLTVGCYSQMNGFNFYIEKKMKYL
jgi:hypothetical protein